MTSVEPCLLLGLVFAFLSLAVTINYLDVVEEEWNEFKTLYKKAYNDANEDKFRLLVFAKNKQKIAKHNQLAMQGRKSYTMKMNRFGDLLHHEFVSNMNGYKLHPKANSTNENLIMLPEHASIPNFVDWRQEEMVTPVKDQGHCGSCYAFSATGALEGQHSRKTGVLVSLSEQNIIDCSQEYGNNGCNGGLMNFAFEYVKINRGIDTEAEYPYEAQDGECRFKEDSIGAYDTGYVNIPKGSEQKLKEAVATVGPISVAIDASKDSFMFYHSGVYYEPDCDSEHLDHAVLVVGYGTTEDGQESNQSSFWWVKNSWGPDWGENGYVRMARNKNNACGIATAASYPLV